MNMPFDPARTRTHEGGEEVVFSLRMTERSMFRLRMHGVRERERESFSGFLT